MASLTYNGVKFSDDTTQTTAAIGFGFKNRIINGGLILNQRVYVSGNTLASGVYGHDRFKGGASGGAYTFTQGVLGVNTTITITAGSIIQVIEGCNMAEGGNYVLSWSGTAQGRLNNGTYGTSGTVVVTGWTPGTNLSVEFNTGTLGNIQLEKGSTATSFDYRPYGTELALCQRYYWSNTNCLIDGLIRASTDTYRFAQVSFPVPMRIAPTITQTWNGGSSPTVDSITTYSYRAYVVQGDTTVARALTSVIATAEL